MAESNQYRVKSTSLNLRSAPRVKPNNRIEVRPGHIAAVVPETTSLKAVRAGTAVTRPLQSQAGGTNFRHGTGERAWWVGSQFKAYGFWYNA